MGNSALGTSGGYDVEGGTDPICWASTYPNSSRAFAMADMPSELDEEFDNLNTYLFANKHRLNVTLRSSCYNGTRLLISPLSPAKDGYLTNTVYTFRLQLEVLPSEIGTNGIIATQNATAWFRLLLCDVIQAGFCNPLYDTTETEDTLTKADTDVGGSAEVEFSVEPIYMYSADTALVGVTQERHIFSRYIRWPLGEVGDGSGRWNTTVDMDFKLPLGEGGVYFFIGHAAMFFTTDDDPTSLVRVDVADAVPSNAVAFTDPPTVLEITTGFIITMCAILGISLVIEFFILSFIIRHRKHTVMKLAQAPFLAMLMGCAIFTTGSCFLLLDFTDITCRLFGPLILTPITMMAAILAGRLWRAYSMLSVALALGTTREANPAGERLIRFLAFLVDWRFADCCRCLRKPGVRRKTTKPGLRTEVTDRDLLKLITILTLPQVLLQVLSSTLLDRGVEVQYETEKRIGRLTCGGDEWWLPVLGIVYVGIIFVCLMVVAWMSRDLPSLFNEKSAIFKAGTVCGIISFLGVTLLLITQDPATSPNVTAFLWIVIVLGVVTALSWFVVMPKIRRVHSGEHIVISHLLAAHRSELGRRYSASTPSSYPSQVHIRPQLDKNGSSGGADVKGSSKEAAAQDVAFGVSSLSLDHDPIEDIPADELAGVDPNDSFRPPQPIVLRKDDPPPRVIETQILKMQDLIMNFSSTSLEGRHIRLQDWQELKESTTALNEHLGRLEFSWEEEQQGE